MKRSTTLFLPLLFVLASCGTPAQYSQQRFEDGIYARPGEEPEFVSLYSEEDFEAMAAANLANKKSKTRDTLVVIIDDPWESAWYHRYSSPWAWGGLGFSSYYWNRWRYGRWYDPWYYDPWYGGYYSYYGSWYDPWYYDPWYYDPWYGGYYGYGVGYGHRYGWYDNPRYAGGFFGGGGRHFGGEHMYVQRSLTESGRSRTSRPGSGSNFRYGTAGSAGSAVLSSRSSTRRMQNRANATSGSSSATSTTTNRSRSEGYNPTRSYTNKNSSSSSGSTSSRSSSGSANTRSYSSSGSSSSSTRSYSSSGSSSSSSSSRSSGGGYSGGGGGGSRSGGSGSSSGRSGGGRR